MSLDPDERQVICEQCQAYLWAEERVGDSSYRLVRCPYECQSDGSMLNPPGNGEQKYGRS